MRLVDRAITKPSRCAVIPYIGQHHPKGFIDTGSELPGFDNHVYISVVAAEEMAALINWSAPKEVKALACKLQDALDTIAALNAQLEEAQAQLDAIDVIESADFRARKKTGRPKKEAA